MATKELTELEMQKISLLLQFLKIAKGGMTKPYDPTPILGKIESFEQSYKVDLSELKKCCPEVAIIRDAKDFKPFIMAALDEFAKIMGLEIYDYKTNRRHGGY